MPADARACRLARNLLVQDAKSIVKLSQSGPKYRARTKGGSARLQARTRPKDHHHGRGRRDRQRGRTGDRSGAAVDLVQRLVGGRELWSSAVGRELGQRWLEHGTWNHDHRQRFDDGDADLLRRDLRVPHWGGPGSDVPQAKCARSAGKRPPEVHNVCRINCGTKNASSRVMYYGAAGSVVRGRFAGDPCCRGRPIHPDIVGDAHLQMAASKWRSRRPVQRR